MENLVPLSGKEQEKSNFSQPYILLSQLYSKKRGSFEDIKLGINGKLEPKGHETSRSPATTLNLLPNIQNSVDQTLRQKAVASTNITTTDFFPQFVGFGSPNPIDDTTNKAGLRETSTIVQGTAQMTIFYAGKVIVFDDFPTDKAKKIMALASKASSNSPTGKISSTNSVASIYNNAQKQLQLQPQANGSEVPIATRASLYQFFAKRKDRAAAKAPYQINNSSQGALKWVEGSN